MTKPLNKVSEGLKNLAAKDYSAQKEQAAKVAAGAKQATVQVAIVAAKASATLSDLMRAVGSKLQEKVPQLGKLSDLLVFYAIYSLIIELLNLSQLQGYFWLFVVKVAPLLVFGLGLSASTIQARLGAKADDQAADKKDDK